MKKTEKAIKIRSVSLAVITLTNAGKCLLLFSFSSFSLEAVATAAVAAAAAIPAKKKEGASRALMPLREFYFVERKRHYENYLQLKSFFSQGETGERVRRRRKIEVASSVRNLRTFYFGSEKKGLKGDDLQNERQLKWYF